MKGTFRFRWVMLITLGVWALVAFCYALGAIRIPDFGFVHTFIAPSILFVVLAPTSIRAIATHRVFTPFWAVWAGVMVPLVNFIGEQATGLGHECDRTLGLAGLIVFTLVFLSWAIGKLWPGCSDSSGASCSTDMGNFQH